jgi:hypothetical protein
MRKFLPVALSFLLFSGAAESKEAPAATASEFCETLPSSADPQKPIKGLKPIIGIALRKLVVGNVMTTAYGHQLGDSSTYFGKDGRFSRAVHRGEVRGTYRVQKGSVRETTDTGGQQTSFALYERKDGISVAHITYHYQSDEVRNYCVVFDRPMTR